MVPLPAAWATLIGDAIIVALLEVEVPVVAAAAVGAMDLAVVVVSAFEAGLILSEMMLCLGGKINLGKYEAICLDPP